MSDEPFEIAFSDPYEVHRFIMHKRHGYCGPYRLGISVGQHGDDLPPPAHYKPASVRQYQQGIEAGRRLSETSHQLSKYSAEDMTNG